MCLDYLDDIVTGRTFAEHLANLQCLPSIARGLFKVEATEMFSGDEGGGVSWLESLEMG